MTELLRLWQETREKEIDAYLNSLALLEEIVAHKREVFTDIAAAADQKTIDDLTALIAKIRAELSSATERHSKSNGIRAEKTFKQIVGRLIGKV